MSLVICSRSEDFFLPFDGTLSGDNRWIKLAELIPWDELEDDFAAKFCNGFGAPAKSFRMALGALLSRLCSGLRMKNWLSRSWKTHVSSFSLAWKPSSIRRLLTHRRWCTSVSAYPKLL